MLYFCSSLVPSGPKRVFTWSEWLNKQIQCKCFLEIKWDTFVNLSTIKWSLAGYQTSRTWIKDSFIWNSFVKSSLCKTKITTGVFLNLNHNMWPCPTFYLAFSQIHQNVKKKLEMIFIKCTIWILSSGKSGICNLCLKEKYWILCEILHNKSILIKEVNW